MNPEDNPEGFKRLREAYEIALSYAGQQKESEEEQQEDPINDYLKQLDEMYHTLSGRLDEKKWESLLQQEILDDLDLGETAKWGIFSYLARHYRIPISAWKILNRTFDIVGNEKEFREHFPANFVDFMLWKIRDQEAEKDFPYEELKGKTERTMTVFWSSLMRFPI